MGLRQGTPGEGGRGAAVHFRYTPTKPGESWHGWIAGPPRWVLCHTASAGTKPCLSWITSGALPCVRCGTIVPPVMIAYVPLYRERDGAPCCVIVHESAADQLAPLKYPMYATVLREGGAADSVCVCAALSKKTYRTTLRSRQSEVDIEPTLLRMWKLNELTEWVRCQAPAGASATVTPPAPAPAPAAEPDPFRKRSIVDTITLALGAGADQVSLVQKKKDEAAARERAAAELKARRNGDGH
jgi:hypothetical protein